MFTGKVGFVGIVLMIASVLPVQADLGDYFVSTDWLTKNFNEVRVVDVRKPANFILGHIENATNISRGEFLFKREGVKSLVPTAGEFKALMEKYGIDADTTVVAYAKDSDPYSARFVWMLKYHGHAKAYVLDGGYTRWAKEGKATSMFGSNEYPSAEYKLGNVQNIRAEAGEVLTRIGHPDVVIWDTRRPTEYVGSEVRADRGGHIPGATHLNWTELQVEKDGVKVLKPKSEILKLLAEFGLSPDKEIIAHCQTGIRSSYASLVLLGLGYGQVKNYDGSWIEWANNKNLPIVASDEAQLNASQVVSSK